jgi:hypothetical protein
MEETMHKIVYAAVALAVLGWSGSAWAVLQETTVTLTDNGEPLPEATITLNRITDSETPPEPKTETTDDSGKIVIVHEDKDKDSDSVVEIIAKTKEGKTITRRILLREFVTSETIDVAVPFETEHAGESSPVAEICPDLTTLDDEKLKIMLGNPELRERIVKLIEETEETEEPETATETKQEENKTVSRPSKEKKKAVQKKPKKQPTITASQKKGPGAAAILGTGLSIGLGVAGSRSGHGGGHRDHMKKMD